MAPRYLLLAALLAAPPAADDRLAPLRSGAASTHGPYESGDCALCHDRRAGRPPGKVTRPVNEICFDCHDEFQGSAPAKMGHPAPRDACTRCHNPHNSRKKKLLL